MNPMQAITLRCRHLRSSMGPFDKRYCDTCGKDMEHADRRRADPVSDWTIVLNLENLTEPEALAVLAQIRAIAGLHCEYGSTMGRDI